MGGLASRLCAWRTWCAFELLFRLVRGIRAHNSFLHRLVLRLANHLLCLGGVVLKSVGTHLHGLAGVLRRDVTQLLGLIIDELGGVVQVFINEILVGDVDKRDKVDECGEE